MILVLCGKIGSGKSTIAKKLELQGFKRIVTYATRPRRDREVDGVDYHFISPMDFYDRDKNGFFLETTAMPDEMGVTRFYGSAKEDYESSENKVVILTPKGVKDLLRSGIDAKVIYLDAADYLCVERALARGNDPRYIRKRMQIERDIFDHFEEECLFDTQITIDSKLSVDQIVDIIIRDLKPIKNV